MGNLRSSADEFYRLSISENCYSRIGNRCGDRSKEPKISSARFWNIICIRVAHACTYHSQLAARRGKTPRRVLRLVLELLSEIVTRCAHTCVCRLVISATIISRQGRVQDCRQMPRTPAPNASLFSGGSDFTLCDGLRNFD